MALDFSSDMAKGSLGRALYGMDHGFEYQWEELATELIHQKHELFEQIIEEGLDKEILAFKLGALWAFTFVQEFMKEVENE